MLLIYSSGGFIFPNICLNFFFYFEIGRVGEDESGNMSSVTIYSLGWLYIVVWLYISISFYFCFFAYKLDLHWVLCRFDFLFLHLVADKISGDGMNTKMGEWWM